ncbi:unnamed protein product, partial [marine sediment metagenome]
GIPTQKGENYVVYERAEAEGRNLLLLRGLTR